VLLAYAFGVSDALAVVRERALAGLGMPAVSGGR